MRAGALLFLPLRAAWRCIVFLAPAGGPCTMFILQTWRIHPNLVALLFSPCFPHCLANLSCARRKLLQPPRGRAGGTGAARTCWRQEPATAPATAGPIITGEATPAPCACDSHLGQPLGTATWALIRYRTTGGACDEYGGQPEGKCPWRNYCIPYLLMGFPFCPGPFRPLPPRLIDGRSD